MTSFEKELIGSCGFSLVPPDGLSAIILVNPRLLLPSKFVLAYARKQNWFGIFEWDEEKRGWYWHTGDYPPGWEKKIKVINILVLSKKAPAKPKSTSKPKPALHGHLQMLPLLAEHEVARERQPLTLRLLLSGE